VNILVGKITMALTLCVFKQQTWIQ